MKRVSFNEDWRYAHLGKEDWQKVTLPHDAMLSEPRNEDSAGGKNIGWFEGHDYEYVKDFEAPEDAAYIEFGGVYHNAEVFLDGKPCPAHPNGYFSFRVPVCAGKHTIRVIAHNADQPNSRWYSGSGIYRPATLVSLPEKHILPDSPFVKTVDYQARKVSVSFETTHGGEVEVEILGKRKKGKKSVEFTLPEAELWSPDHPVLYTARLTYGVDTQEVRFGIRTVEVDAKEGFRINGVRIILKGACIHHDNGLLGAAAHPFASRRKIELIKKAGYNAIRSAHNPAGEAILEACDELGVLVLDEYVDMWYIHKTQYDYARLFEKNWKDDLRQLVTRDRNHPSVVMYSIGNEVSETAQKKGIDLTKEMVGYLHSLDERPVTCGVNIFFNFLSSMGLGVYSDDKAKAEAESAKTEKTGGKKKKAVGSEFINNVAGLLGAGFMKFGATLHGSNVRTRDAYANMDIAGYNYGVNRYRRDLKNYPDRVIVGSETFASDAMTFIDIAQEHPALIGDFVWTGMDYLGEVGLGCWEYKDYAPDFGYGPGWVSAGAGTLDLIGTETSQLAYTQVAFGLSPVRIGVEPVCFSGQKHSPAAWRFTNAIESWSWDGCEGKEAKIEVYARGREVELQLNGRSLGKKRLNKNGIAFFKTSYAPGTLTAIVYSKEGKEIARTSLQSAGPDTELRLIPEKETVKKGDLAYVRLRLTDRDGVLKPKAREEIRVQVEGGRLLALGSACPYSAEGFLTDRTGTYFGEAMAVIEPMGNVTVRAECALGDTEVAIAFDDKGSSVVE